MHHEASALGAPDDTGAVPDTDSYGEMPEADPELLKKIDGLLNTGKFTEAIPLLEGLVKEHGKIKGTYELDAKDVRVVAPTAREYPISPKEHGTDFLMDHRHLWLRSKRQHAIMRVRHAIIKAVRA